MADTNTPNILLLLPDLNDTFNFGAHVENNFTTIDSLMGAVDCTSTSRPTNTYKGQIVYEHDSLRYVQNTGTKASPVWTYMSHMALPVTSGSLPTSGLAAGSQAYLTDIGAMAYYSGGAWHTDNLIVCTSSTRPTGGALQTGSFIYETDTLRMLVYNGSAWVNKAFANFVCTSSTHPASPFQGLEIYETDTGLNAVYNGSNYSYAVSQAAPTVTLGTTTASVTFSGLSTAVNSFLVKWSARCSDANAAEQFKVQLNGASGSSYIWEVNQANNTTVAATTSAGASTFIQIGTVTAASATADYWASGMFTVDNGSASQFPTVQGTAAAFATTTNMWCGVYSGLYAVATTVTSITMFGATGSFVAGSQFSIYGMQ